jgi:UDP-N-acetylmuramoyl-L-alanyl-D-glutamate--2,6-diaminopimelate ligase
LLLKELIADIDGLSVTGDTDIHITGLTSDSRDVRAGYLFAAFPGAKADGRAFINAAAKQGASAVLAAAGTPAPAGTVMIESDNPRRDFSRMAAAFYGRQMPVIAAVTGTNGKSSTVNFCRQIWQSMEHAAAALGTIGIIANLKGGSGINKPGILTTPDPVVLHSEISELEAAGVTHLAFEASSIGLDQYRLHGVDVTTAAFTNLTRDHLDYHGTMENYFLSKLRLFTEVLKNTGVAVVFMDTPYSERITEACHARGIRVISVGRHGNDIKLNSHKPLPTGQFIDIAVMGERYALELPLIGDFQAINALIALGLVIAAEPDNRLLHMQGVHALERLQSVRGRLEFACTHPNGAAVYVDYAHTPDGLETMLNAVRPHALGRLHVVFGCGGDRDRGKRPMMGAIAARLADNVIVTDDNPRTENAEVIRAEVMAGTKDASATVTEISGRRDAIRRAVAALAPDDLLVIAGKGHEQGQIVGKDILPFDDVTEAKNAVLELTK